MNDLTELRDGWGQPEPPSAEAYVAARAALMQRATAVRAAMAERDRLTAVSEIPRKTRGGQELVARRRGRTDCGGGCCGADQRSRDASRHGPGRWRHG
jgi:hypothetical protein